MLLQFFFIFPDGKVFQKENLSLLKEIYQNILFLNEIIYSKKKISSQLTNICEFYEFLEIA